MARNDGIDRTTVRNQSRTESNIADAEAHNERLKTCYRNEDIISERSSLNIHFKEPLEAIKRCSAKWNKTARSLPAV